MANGMVGEETGGIIRAFSIKWKLYHINLLNSNGSFRNLYRKHRLWKKRYLIGLFVNWIH